MACASFYLSSHGFMERIYYLFAVACHFSMSQGAVKQDTSLERVNPQDDKKAWVVANETGRVRPIDMK